MKIASLLPGNPDQLWTAFWTLFFFVIYDTESGAPEFIPNPKKTSNGRRRLIHTDW